jgi:hypothetical protein
MLPWQLIIKLVSLSLAFSYPKKLNIKIYKSAFTGQNPSCESDSGSAPLKITCHLWDPSVYYDVHKGSATGPYSEPGKSNPQPQILFLGEPF